MREIEMRGAKKVELQKKKEYIYIYRILEFLNFTFSKTDFYEDS